MIKFLFVSIFLCLNVSPFVFGEMAGGNGQENGSGSSGKAEVKGCSYQALAQRKTQRRQCKRRFSSLGIEVNSDHLIPPNSCSKIENPYAGVGYAFKCFLLLPGEAMAGALSVLGLGTYKDAVFTACGAKPSAKVFKEDFDGTTDNSDYLKAARRFRACEAKTKGAVRKKQKELYKLFDKDCKPDIRHDEFDAFRPVGDTEYCQQRAVLAELDKVKNQLDKLNLSAQSKGEFQAQRIYLNQTLDQLDKTISAKLKKTKKLTLNKVGQAVIQAPHAIFNSTRDVVSKVLGENAKELADCYSAESWGNMACAVASIAGGGGGLAKLAKYVGDKNVREIQKELKGLKERDRKKAGEHFNVDKKIQDRNAQLSDGKRINETNKVIKQLGGKRDISKTQSKHSDYRTQADCLLGAHKLPNETSQNKVRKGVLLRKCGFSPKETEAILGYKLAGSANKIVKIGSADYSMDEISKLDYSGEGMKTRKTIVKLARFELGESEVSPSRQADLKEAIKRVRSLPVKPLDNKDIRQSKSFYYDNEGDSNAKRIYLGNLKALRDRYVEYGNDHLEDIATIDAEIYAIGGKLD